MSSNILTLPARRSELGRLLKFVLGFFVSSVILLPVGAAFYLGSSNSLVDNSLTGWGMWGAFAIHMWLRPFRREILTTVLLGLLFRLAYDITIGEHGYPGYVVIEMGTFLGLASLAVLGRRSLEADNLQRAACRRSLGMIALLSYLGICLGFYLAFARVMLPRKLDAYLYCFDGSLGFEPSFLVARLVRGYKALDWFEVTVYNSLGLWFSILYAVHANARRKYPVNVVKLMVANAFIGFSLYFAFPAMGPKYAFPSFPALPADIHPAATLLAGIPNAMPSLHFGGALLICWMSKPWKWMYRVTAIFATATALATLSTGEHYLVDLVVAVPYALAILALAAELPSRRMPLAVGSVLILMWMAFLRWGHFNSALSWVLVLCTLAVCVILQRRLAEQLWAEPTG